MHAIPVAVIVEPYAPIFTLRYPDVFRTRLVQTKLSNDLQLFVERELGLKMFKPKSSARTTTMISIAHPYVIRYSIALCSFILPLFSFQLFRPLHELPSVVRLELGVLCKY